MRNLCAKIRPLSNPYEIWKCGEWEWHVLKKWQADDNKVFSRWFCLVKSPYAPKGEMGDVYVYEIKQVAVRIYQDPILFVKGGEQDVTK